MSHLNEWLSRDVIDRQQEIRSVAARVDELKDGLFPFNEVADHMISFCNRVIDAEKAKGYDWKEMWGEKNKWEVWKEIWEQHIEKEKENEKYWEDGKFSQEKWVKEFSKDHWYWIGKKIVTRK